jgi:hypothetical protein
MKESFAKGSIAKYVNYCNMFLLRDFKIYPAYNEIRISE